MLHAYVQEEMYIHIYIYMSRGLNSLKGGYAGDYIGDYCR